MGADVCPEGGAVSMDPGLESCLLTSKCLLFLLPQDCSVPRQPPAWPEGARWVFLKCINKQEGKPREDKPETLPTWLRGLNATAGFALLRKVPSVP